MGQEQQATGAAARGEFLIRQVELSVGHRFLCGERLAEVYRHSGAYHSRHPASIAGKKFRTRLPR